MTEPTPIHFSDLGNRLEEPIIAGLMKKALNQKGLLSLAAGFTDNATLPLGQIESLTHEILSIHADPSCLQYGTNQGRPLLRKAVIDGLRTYPGETLDGVSEDQVVITNGSQQALYISAQILCNPGDIVLVESPSYFVFLELLKNLGIEAVSIPVNERHEVDPDAFAQRIQELKAAGKEDRIKLAYLIGYYANSSTRCLALQEKQRILNILKEEKLSIPIIEDGAYRDLYFTKPYPAASLLSQDWAREFPIIYTGTFTKPYATGFKLGYAISNSQEWLANLLRVKAHQDFGSSNFLQALVEKAFLNGNYAEHLKEIRPHYQRKMDHFDGLLREHGLAEHGWSWQKPEGGILIWIKAPEGLDTGIHSPFCQKCLEENVIYVPGELCFAEKSHHSYARLALGSLTEAEMDEAIRRFSKASEALA